MRRHLLFVGLIVAFWQGSPSQAQAVSARAQWLKNLQAVHKALWDFHADQKQFPTDIRDAKGLLLLSWRVRLLPYLGEDELYKQFRLKEPWDSPHNGPLVKKIPPIFLSPYLEKTQETGRTLVGMPRGPGTWLADHPRPTYSQLNFDMAQTLLLVELAGGVVWTKPDDWAYDERHPLKGLGQAHRENLFLEAGTFVVAADGTPRFLSQSTPPEVVRALVGPTQGKVILMHPWHELLFQPGLGLWMGPALLYSAALALWALAILVKNLRGRVPTPGEWLCLIIGVQQWVYLVNFARVYQIELVPPVNQDQQHMALWYYPRLAGAFACLVIWWLLIRENGWNILFFVLAVALGIDTVDARFPFSGRPGEESLLVVAAPLALGGAAIGALVLTWAGTEYFGKQNRPWVHWMALLAALIPLAWFVYWWQQGLVPLRPVLVRLLA